VLPLACWHGLQRGAPTIIGPAAVVDGDSLTLTGTSIRLFGIDAPEGSQTCQRKDALWSCGDDAHCQ